MRQLVTVVGVAPLVTLAAAILLLCEDATAGDRTVSSSRYRSYSGAKAIDGDTFRRNASRGSSNLANSSA